MTGGIAPNIRTIKDPSHGIGSACCIPPTVRLRSHNRDLPGGRSRIGHREFRLLVLSRPDSGMMCWAEGTSALLNPCNSTAVHTSVIDSIPVVDMIANGLRGPSCRRRHRIWTSLAYEISGSAEVTHH